MIVLTFLIFNNISFAQSNHNLSKTEIDSVLSYQFDSALKIDTISSLTGHTKFYKKLGFIKFRTGKGFSYNYKVICDDTLYMVGYFNKKVKKSRYEVFHYNYYYINNKLYKYETVENWENRDNDSVSLKHKVLIYLNGSNIIDKVIDIRDNYKHSKIDIDTIVDNSVKELNNYKEIKKLNR